MLVPDFLYEHRIERKTEEGEREKRGGRKKKKIEEGKKEKEGRKAEERKGKGREKEG